MCESSSILKFRNVEVSSLDCLLVIPPIGFIIKSIKGRALKMTLLLLKIEIVAPVLQLSILKFRNMEVSSLDSLLVVPSVVCFLLSPLIGFVVEGIDLLSR